MSFRGSLVKSAPIPAGRPAGGPRPAPSTPTSVQASVKTVFLNIETDSDVVSCSQTSEGRLELCSSCINSCDTKRSSTVHFLSSPELLALCAGISGGSDLHLMANPAQRLSDAGVNSRFIPHGTADAPARGSNQFPPRRVLTGQWAATVALATGPQT